MFFTSQPPSMHSPSHAIKFWHPLGPSLGIPRPTGVPKSQTFDTRCQRRRLPNAIKLLFGCILQTGGEHVANWFTNFGECQFEAPGFRIISNTGYPSQNQTHPKYTEDSQYPAYHEYPQYPEYNTPRTQRTPKEPNTPSAPKIPSMNNQ